MPRQSRPVAFWLEQIVSFSERLDGHASGIERQTFTTDPKSIDAVSWCIACIGEACGKILEIDGEMDRRFPSLRLTDAYLARNRYVHGYFDLDVEQVWDTALKSVPELAEAARSLLAEGKAP
ncbi:HepT-like ribonuclease domain-containing protein [Aquibium sp. LZ166]|uniref:HepT-like ribonuclease domain-containing protein n=1 Tax=Aquibium pacificus TaxID=3153579 RepID=A0ABV3SR80_9HYPH